MQRPHNMISTTTPHFAKLTLVAILFSIILKAMTLAKGKALIFQKEFYRLMGSPSTLFLKKTYDELTEYSMQSSSFHTHLSPFSRERLKICTTPRS